MNRAINGNFPASLILSLIWLSLLSGGLAKGAPGENSYTKQAAISETGGKIHLVANDSRPLLQGLEALQQKYGWRIDYEDPQYISKLDFQELNAPDDKSSPVGGRRIPAGGAFVVEFPAGATPDSAPDEQKTLQLVVDAYNHSNNPGRFEVWQYPDRFAVIGTAAHDGEGKISPTPPLLDSKVALPAEERTVSDTFELIAAKTSDKSPVKVAVGIIPFGLDRAHISVGGKELTARDYLENAITTTGRKLCWRLLFDPESKSYVLNFHRVKMAAAKPAANPVKP
jgi:hypothetical protein